MGDGVTNYFENFLKKESMFIQRGILSSGYVPDEIHHRDEQLQQIAHILAPSLKSDKPSNLFLYGKTGTGKTLVMKHMKERLEETARNNNVPLKILYLNCKLKKIADTEYRIVAELARHLGKTIPPTGLPTDEVYNFFYQALDEQNVLTVIILDEIDQLVKKVADEIIYNFTRINTELKKARVSIVGISNDLLFINNLDPRVKSSLSEEELVFPPYNALQIQDILRKRANLAFREGSVEPGVIEKCAAFAAREHGDARRALELLRVAGELAERNNEKSIQIAHLDAAEDKIERDKIHDIVKTQPKQFQLVLYAIFSIAKDKREGIFTGEIYEKYAFLCKRIGLRPLTQRRVSDVLAEFDMFGIINAKVISKGRFGRTREISLSLADSIEVKIAKLLEQELQL
ncbi:MAG: ORC1-type DNA replication protein [Nanoarchaeota archaeon]